MRTSNELSTLYKSIDQKNISESAKETLKKIRLANKNFKGKDEDAQELFIEFFNKLKSSKPVAVKTTQEYKDALKKAQIERGRKMREGKGKPKEPKGEGNEVDANRPAKPFGWRMRGKHNYRKPTRDDISKGKAYYEGRVNRADVKRKKYPMLERGGMAEEVYYVNDFYPNYDEDKIAQVLKSNGFKKVRKGRKYGWSNQPEVVIFEGDKNMAKDILEKEFDNYISINEKDWGRKYEEGGEINGNYLNSISADKKERILKNIAKHYGISLSKAEEEVKDSDAEMLYEYIANDNGLRMSIYNDIENKKYEDGGYMAKGGGVLSLYKIIFKNSKGEYEYMRTEAYNKADAMKVGKYFETYPSQFMRGGFKVVEVKEVEPKDKYEDGGYMAKGGKINYDLYENKSPEYIEGEIAHTERSGRQFRIMGDSESADDRKQHADKLWDILRAKKANKMADGGYMAEGGEIKTKLKDYKSKVEGYFPNIEPTKERSWYLLETPQNEKVSFILESRSIYSDVGSSFLVYDKNYKYLGSANVLNGFNNIKRLKITKSDVKFEDGGYMAEGGEVGMAEWSVTIESEDGETYDWVGFAKNEDNALYKTEQEAGFTSISSGINMITDEDGNKVEYAKGGYMENGGAVGKSFTISEMNEKLDRMFPDSFGFSVGTFSNEGNKNRNSSALIANENDPFRGLKDSDIDSKLFFPQYKRVHDIRFRIYQGGENTYFYFNLESEKGDEYIGQFGFKDQGNVPSSYITRFIAFLMEQYGLPFEVNHSVMAKGGILKEDDSVWNALGKRLLVDKVTKDEYYLVGYGQPFASPFVKSKVDNYIKKGEWTLKPKEYAKGGTIGGMSTYVSARDIEEIKLTINGDMKTLKGSDLMDGVYVKKASLKAKFDAYEVYNKLSDMASNVWDKLKIESGSQIYNSDAIQKKLQVEYEKAGIDSLFKSLTKAQRKKVAEILTDENQHSLRNYLALRGYEGDMEYNSYKDGYDNMPKDRKYYISPYVITRVVTMDEGGEVFYTEKHKND